MSNSNWVETLLSSTAPKIEPLLTSTNQYLWAGEVFFVVLLTLLANFFARRFLAKLEIKLTQTKSPWDDALLNALSRPLAIFIWVVGISFAIEISEKAAGQTFISFYKPIRDIAVIALIAGFFWRFSLLTEINLLKPEMQRKPVDATTIHAIGKLLRASILITACLIVLQYFGYSISGVLAFGGIGGIAVGFAAKDLLANFFGGLMLYLDRPFKVGDWIRSPDRNIEGTVEEIGWRLTRIRTFDKRPLYVPNSTFANISVENPSRMTNRRIKTTIGVRYQDFNRVATLANDIKLYLMHHPDIDQHQTLIVNFNEFSASSLDFYIYTFTKTTNWIKYHAVKEEVLLGIGDIILNAGAEIAFPTSTVHLIKDNDSQPLPING